MKGYKVCFAEEVLQSGELFGCSEGLTQNKNLSFLFGGCHDWEDVVVDD